MRKFLLLIFFAVLIPALLLAGESGGEDPPFLAYDLIVMGGEPEGIAAAVSAARNGLKTLLLEDDEALGGLMTLGKLNFLDMNYGPKKELLTQGIFQEFYKKLGNAFDVEEAKKYFLNLVQNEQNITLKLNTSFLEPILEDNKIVGVKVKEKGEIKGYRAPRIIDASVDADVAAAAGVPYTVGAEDYGRKDKLMGVTLVFELKGVNWPYVFIYNNWNRLISKINSRWGDPHAGATLRAAWGYGEQALEYTPQDPMMRLRGPNLARQKNGHVLVNALLIFGVDGLDPQSKALGIERGKRELPNIIKFMREKFPGFAKAELVGVAEQLYVRETRHIVGEYRLTITDVLENRDHWDRIAHGSYPVDVQPTGPKDLGDIVGKPAIYSIPFRCLVPQKIDNLLVVGRSASFDSLAHGSARVIPVGMAAGEAAGVAAAYSIQNNLTFRDMTKSKDAISWVQERLKKQGAYLVEYTPPRPKVMDHWAYPGVRVMRELGLASGGYSNNYGLEKEVQYWDVDRLLNSVIKRASQLNPKVPFIQIPVPEQVTKGEVLLLVGEAIHGNKLTMPETTELLVEKGILNGELKERFKDANGKPNFGEIYMLMAQLYKYLVTGVR